jgi:nucleoid-associated protein YgaU
VFGRIVLLVAVAFVLWAVLARDSGAGGPERLVVVRAGDTLWTIAERSYVGDPREGVWRLRERNDLDSATIRPGQVLAVP